jgi:hypothetical protein
MEKWNKGTGKLNFALPGNSSVYCHLLSCIVGCLMSDVYLDVPVSREKNVHASWNSVLSRFYIATCTPVCISVMRTEALTQSANSVYSLKGPKDGMFIVSCWPLREAGPAVNWSMNVI